MIFRKLKAAIPVLILKLNEFFQIILFNEKLTFFRRFNHQHKFSQSQRISKIRHQIEAAILEPNIMTKIMNKVNKKLVRFARNRIKVDA